MALRIGTPLPSFEGATEWLNREPAVDELTGRPILVHFWAVSCPGCKANLPRLRSLAERFGISRLNIVAVHLPRSEADTDAAVVRLMVQQENLTEPCAIDNTHTIGDRFGMSGLWPAYYLFDAGGKLKRYAAGGVGLNLIESALERINKEAAAPA